MKFLPRAASAVTFQNPPFSPGREKQRSSAYAGTGGRGFSSPIISIIPAKARRKSRKKESYDAQEPTSPKISCMGQIKHKKKLHKSRELANKSKILSSSSSSKSNSSSKEIKKQKSSIRNIFRGAKLPGRKSDSSLADKPPLPNKAPSLSQVKRFASGRDTFANFDWTAQIAPVDSDHRNYYSDEERRDSEEEEEEEDIIIPFSAPMMVGGGGISLEPRKEVNLWKRRTMAPPAPLQLKSVVKKSY